MTIEIDVIDEKIGNFSGLAIGELRSQISDISTKLVDEAIRIEVSERLKGNPPEITASYVQSASEIFLRRYNCIKGRNKRIKLGILSYIFTSVSSIAFTLTFSVANGNALMLLLSLLLFGVAITLSVLSLINKL